MPCCIQEVDEQEDSQLGDASLPANGSEGRTKAAQGSESEDQEEGVERPTKVAKVDENRENKGK